MPTRPFDDVFKSLRKGDVPNVLYLFGPEDVLKEEALGEIVGRVLDPSLKEFNLDTRSATTLDSDQVETLCRTLPMMADRRVVVIRDVESWTKRAKAKTAVLRYLDRPAPETILVLVQGAGDGEPDPELAAKSTSSAALPLPPERVRRWLDLEAARLGVTFDDPAAAHLVRATGGGLSDLRSELAKLAGLGGGTALTLDRVVDFLGVRHGETQLDWRDRILRSEPSTAIAILPHVLSQTGVSGVSLVSLLATSIVGMGLARAHFDRGTRGPALHQAIKATLFRTRPGRLSYDAAAAEWSRLAPRWPAERIERSLVALRRADERLKNTAVSDEKAILFDLIAELTVPWQEAA
jgi:DNA polymerase-3 subunit delta